MLPIFENINLCAALFLNVNTCPALVTDERNYVIEIGGVNGPTLWAGDLLHTVFCVGLGRSWDPYFEVTALDDVGEIPKRLGHCCAEPGRIVSIAKAQSGADLISIPEQLDLTHSEEVHTTILNKNRSGPVKVGTGPIVPKPKRPKQEGPGAVAIVKPPPGPVFDSLFIRLY